MTQTKANIALLLGDPAGIGPELISNLLKEEITNKANIVVIGEKQILDNGNSGLLIPCNNSKKAADLINAAKKPMILVPFANSADNHQLKNALEIEKKGGAIAVNEEDFTISNTTKLIENLVDTYTPQKENSGSCPRRGTQAANGSRL